MKPDEQTNILILGERSVTVRALELLLAGAGRHVCSQDPRFAEEAERSPRSVDLVLLMPLASPRVHRALMQRLSEPGWVNVPVFELVTAYGKLSRPAPRTVVDVPWPCTIRELAERLELAPGAII